MQNNTIQKNDYEELEEKEIVYEYTSDDRVQAIVVGCDAGLGITIVNKEDTSEKLVCLPGPESHLSGDYEELGGDAVYNVLFPFIVEKIKEGLLCSDDINEALASADSRYEYLLYLEKRVGGVLRRTPMYSCPFDM